jgi:hypothetical protein
MHVRFIGASIFIISNTLFHFLHKVGGIAKLSISIIWLDYVKHSFISYFFLKWILSWQVSLDPYRVPFADKSVCRLILYINITDHI